MKSVKKNQVVFIFTIILVFILVFKILISGQDSDYIDPKSTSAELIQKSKFWTPLISSIPSNESDAIMQKLIGMRLLSLEVSTDEYEFYSRNGKIKGLFRSLHDIKSEGFCELSIFDSVGAVIWKDFVGSRVTLSNNGINFTDQLGMGCLLRFYNITRGHSPLVTTRDCYDVYRFSESGNHFIAAGRFLDLYTANGELLWRRYTGTEAGKLLVTNDDFSRIAVMSNTGMFGDSVPDFRNAEPSPDIEQPGPKDPYKRMKSTADIEEEMQKISQMIEAGRKKASSDKSVKKSGSRKSYLTYLNGEGDVISQMELDYRFTDAIEFSPTDQNLIIVDARFEILLIDIEAQSILWRYPGDGNPLRQITNVCFSEDGNLLAAGVISHAGKKDSPRYVIVLNKKGELIQEIATPDIYASAIHGPSVVLGEKDYLLIKGAQEMWVYKIFRNY